MTYQTAKQRKIGEKVIYLHPASSEKGFVYIVVEVYPNFKQCLLRPLSKSDETPEHIADFSALEVIQ